MKPQDFSTPETAPPASAVIATRDQALAYLLGRINYERTPSTPYGQRQLKLDRMRQLLTRLGNPDAGLPIVHVAGTKGKGSTSAMIAGVLQSAGFDVGVFSSPHLEAIEERFSINGQQCPTDEFVTLVERLRPVVEAMDQEAASGVDQDLSPTYFELTTALALLHFVERNVDAAVLEVGLGGRLDSTNVCQPVVTLITSISYDHTKQLGNTLAEIAAEKAGIIKPGVPLLCGPLGEEARTVIARIAEQHGCRMTEAGRDFTYNYRPATGLEDHDAPAEVDVTIPVGDEELRHNDVPLHLVGEHQAANAALALATIEELRRQGWLISTDAMREGISRLALPARAEVLRRHPTVLVDVAHNVASARALAQVLRDSFDCTRRKLILSIARDKDIRGIVQELLPLFSEVMVTEFQENPRAVKADKLARIVREEWQRLGRKDWEQAILIEPQPQSAWQAVQSSAESDELVCITGSFFIAAELRRELLKPTPGQPLSAENTAARQTGPSNSSSK